MPPIPSISTNEFEQLPVAFDWRDSSSSNPNNPPSQYSKVQRSLSNNENPCRTVLDNDTCFPQELFVVRMIANVAADAFAKGIFTVDSMNLGSESSSSSTSGQPDLFMQPTERFKLRTHARNVVDTVFFKNIISDNRNKLVICCEGIGGRYEAWKRIRTPFAAGYSVLGWNYPSLGYSSGHFYPDQVVAAADTVMKFAIEKLEFMVEDIIVFGYSFGGFPASWLAEHYPSIRGVILDGTFDQTYNLATLASGMMAMTRPFLRETLRSTFSCDNVRHLTFYNGPVLIISRLHDEIMRVFDFNTLSINNRTTQLMIKLLQTRFPNLINNEAIENIHSFLSRSPKEQEEIMNPDVESFSQGILFGYIKSKRVTMYPILIGEERDNMSLVLRLQVVLFLVKRHLSVYDSTHQTPLPKRFFQPPFDILKEAQNYSGHSWFDFRTPVRELNSLAPNITSPLERLAAGVSTGITRILSQL
jgi:pimeloyl-ACP methyl ester carboxylesterase